MLPAGARPVTVLHLTDMHLLPWQRRKIAWIAGLAEHEPDLVVHTGDVIAHPDSIEAAVPITSSDVICAAFLLPTRSP